MCEVRQLQHDAQRVEYRKATTRAKVHELQLRVVRIPRRRIGGGMSTDDSEPQAGGPGMTDAEVWELAKEHWDYETFARCLELVRDGAYEQCRAAVAVVADRQRCTQGFHSGADACLIAIEKLIADAPGIPSQGEGRV